MQSSLISNYDHLKGGRCHLPNPKHAAIIAGVYMLNASIVVLLLYTWRIGVNMQKATTLGDVYYGVQIAYFAIVGIQLFIAFLSIVLLIGIYKQNYLLLIPWIVGCITFMALEAMAVVYSNILRDHVNKQFDVICQVEMSFFLSRIIINVAAIGSALKYLNLLRAGIFPKGFEAIEL